MMMDKTETLRVVRGSIYGNGAPQLSAGSVNWWSSFPNNVSKSFGIRLVEVNDEKTSKRGTAHRRWCRGGCHLDVPGFAQICDRWNPTVGRYHDLVIGFRLVEEIDAKD